jgi:hypothetical protein
MNTSAQKQREFRESDGRLNHDPMIKTAIMIAARVTGGRKPVMMG